MRKVSNTGSLALSNSFLHSGKFKATSAEECASSVPATTCPFSNRAQASLDGMQVDNPPNGDLHEPCDNCPRLMPFAYRIFSPSNVPSGRNPAVSCPSGRLLI